MLSGKLELVYNLENQDYVELVYLKAQNSYRKNLGNMKKENMLDLIYKKLLKHDEMFVKIQSDIVEIKADIVEIKADIVKIKNCPTIQKEIEK